MMTSELREGKPCVLARCPSWKILVRLSVRLLVASGIFVTNA
jgi:hypothetical protein